MVLKVRFVLFSKVKLGCKCQQDDTSLFYESVNGTQKFYYIGLTGKSYKTLFVIFTVTSVHFRPIWHILKQFGHFYVNFGVI